jgi:DNA repair exonuclease SbcCD ATPase subunit
MAAQKQKNDAEVQQHQQAASAAQQRLQETTQQLKEVQRQLEEAQGAAADAKKRRDDAEQLQVCTRDQYNALSTTHKVGPDAGEGRAPSGPGLSTLCLFLRLSRESGLSTLCASGAAGCRQW